MGSIIDCGMSLTEWSIPARCLTALSMSAALVPSRWPVSDVMMVPSASSMAERTGVPCSAIELADGTIITAQTSPLLGPSAALILNAIKHLAGISHDEKLIPQEMIEPIQHTKVEYLRSRNPRLHTDEVLVVLSALSLINDSIRRALAKLPELRGCQMHSTVMLGEVDHKIFKKLGVGLTCDPTFKRK